MRLARYWRVGLLFGKIEKAELSKLESEIGVLNERRRWLVLMSMNWIVRLINSLHLRQGGNESFLKLGWLESREIWTRLRKILVSLLAKTQPSIFLLKAKPWSKLLLYCKGS